MTEKELMKKLAQGMFDRIPDLNDIPPAQEEFSEEHRQKWKNFLQNRNGTWSFIASQGAF